MGEEKQLTLEEVAEKTSPDSYMLVIHNKVYDVTNFISEVNNCKFILWSTLICFMSKTIQHPGGAEILLDVVGEVLNFTIDSSLITLLHGLDRNRC